MTPRKNDDATNRAAANENRIASPSKDDEMPLEPVYDSYGMDASIRVEPLVKRAYLTFTKVLGMSHPVARAVCAEGMFKKE